VSDLPHGRVYAHLRSYGFDLACPKCGRVTIVGLGQPSTVKHSEAGWRRTLRQRRHAYDDRTQRWTCAHCRATYVLGILVWPLPGKIRSAANTPADTVPSLVEAADLRGQLSLVQREPYTTRGLVNRRCTCGDGCPMHDATGRPERG